MQDGRRSRCHRKVSARSDRRFVSPANSVETVLKPGPGIENARGIMTSQFTKLAGYAARADDPETKDMSRRRRKWLPSDGPGISSCFPDTPSREALLRAGSGSYKSRRNRGVTFGPELSYHWNSPGSGMHGIKGTDFDIQERGT
jgi:hypothetical protein